MKVILDLNLPLLRWPCDLAIVRLLLVISLLAVPIHGVNAQAVNVERSETIPDVRLIRSGLHSGNATARLSFDVDYLYRARVLMGEPVINCGARVRNIRGTVEFVDDGQSHVVPIGPQNAHLIRIQDIDLLITKSNVGTFPPFVALMCNVGLPGREDGANAFNVPSSPNWDALYCTKDRNPDLGRTEKLHRDGLCTELAPLGRYLSRDEAISIYRNEDRHMTAWVSVGAIRFSVDDLIRSQVEIISAVDEVDPSADRRATERLRASLSRIREDRVSAEREETGDASDAWQQPAERLARSLADISQERRQQTEPVNSRNHPAPITARVDESPVTVRAKSYEPRLIGDRFLDNGDGTVTDTTTRLMWMRCAMGQHWNGSSCAGEEALYRWQEAMVIRHQFAGYADWRLPNFRELDGLVHCDSGERYDFVSAFNGSCIDQHEAGVPAINIEAFPNIDGKGFAKYWSSSRYEDERDSAYAIDFVSGGFWVGMHTTGFVDTRWWGNLSHSYRVRMVRSLP